MPGNILGTGGTHDPNWWGRGILDWMVARNFLKFQPSQECPGAKAQRAKAQRQEEAWHRPFRPLHLLYSKVLKSSVVLSCLPNNTAQYTFLKHLCAVSPVLKHIKCSLSLNAFDLTVHSLLNISSPVLHRNPLVSSKALEEEALFLFISPITFPSSLHPPHFHIRRDTLISQSQNFRAEVPTTI